MTEPSQLRGGFPPLTELRAIFLGIEGVLCPPRWTILKTTLLSELANRRHAIGERTLERAVAGLERQPRRRGQRLERYGSDWVRALVRRLGIADADFPEVSALLPTVTPEDLYPDVVTFLDALRALAIARVVVAFPGDPSPYQVTRDLGIGEYFEVLVAVEDEDAVGLTGRGVLLTALEACHVRAEQAACVLSDPEALREAEAVRVRSVRLARDDAEAAGAVRTLEALLPESTRVAAESSLL